MNAKELEQLGFTPDDVLNRLVNRLVEQHEQDEEGYASDFNNRIAKAVKDRIDEQIKLAIDKHVLPRVNQMVEEVCLQTTNEWGEKLGKKQTFIEYLVARADFFLREKVNYKGKIQSEDNYGWQAHGTRVSYMIHEHLQYSIATAMQKALGEVDGTVRKGLQDAVNIALQNIKVTVNTKVE